MSAIIEFLNMFIDFFKMLLESLMTLFQMLTTGIPVVLSSLANMPGFIFSGVTVTISICLCMVILGRRSS